MAQSIKPVGHKILVLPLEEKNHVTKGNIELVDNQLMCGKVVEVGEETKAIYSIGDTVIFPKHSGVTQYYNGEHHLWLNGIGAPNGDIWGIETEM